MLPIKVVSTVLESCHVPCCRWRPLRLILTDSTSKVVTVERLDILDLERVNVEVIQSKESNSVLLVSSEVPQ